jgi:thiamine biosynthesis lipoprotein
MAVEVRFGSMGSDAHVIVNGGPDGIIQAIRDRIAELERMWTRFDSGSELMRLNSAAGRFYPVSEETLTLIRCGVEGWRRTGGLFDPTVLGSVIRAGYDRDFAALATGAAPGSSPLQTAAGGILVTGRSVLMPKGAGFDSGGLGKGLAADMVTAEAMAAGAEGVCINLGGDLRVRGTSPDSGGWTASVDHPHRSEPLALVGMSDGAIATSTTLLRRWTVDGEERHHLIDPRSGCPSDGEAEFVTVIAKNAWLAEVLAKAALIDGGEGALQHVENGNGEGIMVLRSGRVVTTPGFAAFTGEGVSRPTESRSLTPSV